ncbi:MAG: GHMP kinase [Cytophagales bacterium]|nr:GHMP kinase [Cytophagales bacterium]
MIRRIAYPRAALFGNPSDGFFGKTIAFPFREFQAKVALEPKLSGIKLQDDDQHYPDIQGLHRSVSGRTKKSLLQAAVKRFADHAKTHQINLSDAGFEINFESNIPLQVGMAGSSAIITATWRALMQYFNLEIPPHLLANEVLAVETQEMGIGAGLQDRVVQAFECPIYMDFDKALMDLKGYGTYEPMQKTNFQNLYIAYMEGEPEGSEIIHNDLRSRYDRGESEVHRVMRKLSELTTEAKKALESDVEQKNLGTLIDRNFDLRQSICQIAPAHLNMIRLAREHGASAKFTGSGGTIIGQYTSEEMYERLQRTFEAQNIHIFKPTIVNQ